MMLSVSSLFRGVYLFKQFRMLNQFLHTVAVGEQTSALVLKS